MNKSSKKLRTWIIVILCAAAVLAAVFALTAQNCAVSTNPLYRRTVSLDTSREMTSSERSEDFSALCDFLEKNSPVIYEGEELYGLSYNEIKNYYGELISSAQSDFEYFSLLKGFTGNIPGTHLNIGFPGSDFMTAEMQSGLSKNKSFLNARDYWYNTLHEACKERYSEEYTRVIFTYYSGEYRCTSEPDGYGMNKATLLSVDGVPADEYIMLLPSVIKIKYDHAAGKPFRDNIIFNDKFGVKCTIEYLSSDGDIRTAELYRGIYAETVMNYIGTFKAADGEETPAPQSGREIILLPDKEHNIITVTINTFNSETVTGEIISDAILKAAEEYDRVIVDIRNNGGGYYDYASEALSALSAEDIEICDKMYRTEESYKRSSDKSGYEKCGNGMYAIYDKLAIPGKAPADTKFYLLISDYTASSADWLAYHFKQNGLGTVLGINAAGGERDGEIFLNFLEKSGIYYYYTEYQSFNPDGTGSSAYGTAPDIYLTDDVESYFIRKQLIDEGEDPFTAENRLKWDGVLRQAIQWTIDNG